MPVSAVRFLGSCSKGAADAAAFHGLRVVPARSAQQIPLWRGAVVLTASPNPSVLGEAVTVAAAVTGPDAAAPTGDVTFTDAEVGAGTCMLERVPLTAGSASLPVPYLPVGTHFITGSFRGDSSFRPSSGVIARRVEEVGSRRSGRGPTPCPWHSTS